MRSTRAHADLYDEERQTALYSIKHWLTNFRQIAGKQGSPCPQCPGDDLDSSGGRGFGDRANDHTWSKPTWSKPSARPGDSGQTATCLAARTARQFDSSSDYTRLDRYLSGNDHPSLQRIRTAQSARNRHSPASRTDYKAIRRRNRRTARRGSPATACAIAAHTREVTGERRLQRTFRIISLAIREL